MAGSNFCHCLSEIQPTLSLLLSTSYPYKLFKHCKAVLLRRNHILGTLDFTGSRHWALSIFLRAQPWICMHMCTLYICFLIWETIIWADEKRKYYIYIYTVCIFFLYKNKQTNRHTKKNSKTTTTTTKTCTPTATEKHNSVF